MAIDPRSGISKGFAYIQFEDPERAEQARSELDGKPFQGRLIHILPASLKRENTIDEYAISKLPIKKQKQIRRKAEAATSIFKWNSMYMNVGSEVVFEGSLVYCMIVRRHYVLHLKSIGTLQVGDSQPDLFGRRH